MSPPYALWRIRLPIIPEPNREDRYTSTCARSRDRSLISTSCEIFHQRDRLLWRGARFASREIYRRRTDSFHLRRHRVLKTCETNVVCHYSIFYNDLL